MNLLIHEPPLQVLPTLATRIGLNEAIVLQQIHYWITNAARSGDRRKQKDGKWWVYNSYREWKENNFPFWSEETIKRTIVNLEESGLIISMQMPYGADRRKWYTIDYAALEKLEQTFALGQNDLMASGHFDIIIGSSCADESSGQNDPINTEIENTSEILCGGDKDLSLEAWLEKKKSEKPKSALPEFPKDTRSYRERITAAVISGAAKHEHGYDMRWCPPDIQDRGLQFVMLYGREPRTQSEISHWIKSIRDQVKIGIPMDCISAAFKQMRNGGLTISSPDSVTKVANDLFSKVLTKKTGAGAAQAASEVHGIKI